MLPPGRLLYMAPGISRVNLLKHARDYFHEETEQKVRQALRAVGFDLAGADRPRRPLPRLQIGRRRFYIVPAEAAARGPNVPE